MKRTVLLTAILAITLLVAVSMVMAQTPSVPNLINFQGRLTDNLGNPVANGAHTVDFYIFSVRTGGVSVWNETQTPTTTGGLFTTQLGSVTPLPQTLFKDYDSLFLEIVADAQTISPRTLLTSTPSSRVADNLEVSSSIFPGQVAFETDPSSHRLSMLGGDGLENFRVWGNNWGEISLHDFQPANNVTALLTANFGSGGELDLFTTGGAPQILLNAGASGDASAIFPTDAVNSGEILDEPGIAQDRNLGSISIASNVTMVDLATVTINIPAPGYIFVVGRGLAQLAGTTSPNGIAAQIDETAGGGLIGSRYSLMAMNPPPSTGFIDMDISAQQTYFKGAAGSYTFRFEGMSFYAPAGSRDVFYPVVTATYYPSAYGGVTTVASSPSEFGNAAVKTAQVKMPSGLEGTETVYQTDLRELGLKANGAARAKQMAELEARIKNLENQVKAGQNPNLAPETPRKER